MEDTDMAAAQRLVNGIPELEEEPLKKKKAQSTDDEDATMAVASHSAGAGAGGSFDCNICFEFAVEPVVTLCGHLYCWPCLYKWLQLGGDHGPQQCCPVCKAALSQNALVPLYGHGRDHAEEPHGRGPAIPRRPTPNLEDHQPHQQRQEERRSRRNHHNWHEYMTAASPLGAPRVFHPTAGGVMGGMAVAVLPLIFRDEQWASIYHTGPYYTTGNNGGGGANPRLRRRLTEIERSLQQIWVFLFCCAILCLLMF